MEAARRSRNGKKSIPQGLKPELFQGIYGTAEAVPFQRSSSPASYEAVPFQRWDSSMSFANMRLRRGRFPASCEAMPLQGRSQG